MMHPYIMHLQVSTLKILWSSEKYSPLSYFMLFPQRVKEKHNFQAGFLSNYINKTNTIQLDRLLNSIESHIYPYILSHSQRMLFSYNVQHLARQ